MRDSVVSSPPVVAFGNRTIIPFPSGGASLFPRVVRRVPVFSVDGAKAAAVCGARQRSVLRDIRPIGMANRPDVRWMASRIPEVSKLDRPDRRIELIRARLEAYYDVKSRGPGRASWKTICGEMYETIGVKMDEEIPRQFVRRIKRREQPRVPDKENLEAIVSFLCHPDIALLSEEELNEPEVPYRSPSFCSIFSSPITRPRFHRLQKH